MERYDYKQHVTNDLYNYFMNDMDEEDRFWLINSTNNEDYEYWFDKLREDDAITGLASGSYTMSKSQAEENLLYNWDLAKDAYLDLFMDSTYDVLDKGPSFLTAGYATMFILIASIVLSIDCVRHLIVKTKTTL